MEIKIVKISDQNYPQGLRNIYDPPNQLFVVGNIEILNQVQDDKVAVVGTRNPTQEKVLVTRKLVARMVKENLTIISGMAVGIDAVAHWAAIENGGKTIAVLGAGVDIVYPPENKKLYEKIIETGGAIISEIPPGKTVAKNIFAARNRIISGLSQSVIVVECSIKSGSMITARMALEQGKDVFCVPGSPGCDYLINQGAGIL